MIWRLIAAFYPDRPIVEAERKEKCLKDTEDMFAPAVTAMFVENIGKIHHPYFKILSKAGNIINFLMCINDRK